MPPFYRKTKILKNVPLGLKLHDKLLLRGAESRSSWLKARIEALDLLEEPYKEHISDIYFGRMNTSGVGFDIKSSNS